MPGSLKNSTKPMDTTNLVPVERVVAAPGISLNTSADPEFSPLSIAPIPPVLGTTTDAARQFYRVGVSQVRMSPLPSQASAAGGAQAQTQVIVNQVSSSGSGNSGSAGLELQVNNMDNPIQNILNITGGSVSYGPGKGQVSIADNNGTIQNNGTPLPQEPALNFISPFVATDNPGNASTDITLTLFYQTMQMAGVSKTQRPRLNFAAPITVVDNGGNNSTDITVPVFVGSGASHAIGLVPDPGASAGITRFVCEDGTFRVPPGTGGAGFYQTFQNAASSLPQEPRANFIAPLIGTDNPGNTSTDISLPNYPGIVARTRKNLASPVSLTGGVAATVDSITITFPSQGNTWYARVTYYYSLDSVGDAAAWAIQAGQTFAASQASTATNRSGVSASGLSPVTYASGASATFGVVIDTISSGTVETGTFGFSTSVSSYMEVEVINAS